MAPTGDRFVRWAVPALVVIACAFVLVHLRPDLLFADTTPTGGDLGAHVWGPAFLKGRLWDHGLLSGWSSDWFGGFPAYRFYMPLPAFGATLLDAVLPYGVALKVMVALPLVALPAVSALWARRAKLPPFGPAIVAAAALLFLFDDSYYRYGGNIASTIVGEYGNALALVAGLATVAIFEHDLRESRWRPACGLVGAVAALCHPIGAIFVLVTLTSTAGVHATLDRAPRVFVRLASTLGVTAVVSAFWYVPLIWYRQYFNDLRFDPVKGIGSLLFPLPVPLELLVGALFVLAVIDSLQVRRRVVLAIAASGLVFALLAAVAPRGILWNARLAPPWLLCRALVAGVGLAVGLRMIQERVPRRRTELVRLGAPFAVIGVILFGISWNAGSLPGGSEEKTTVGDGLELVSSYQWVVGSSHTPNRVGQFATFGFGGYERGPVWSEYQDLIDTMRELGASEGCGRALGEFDPEGTFGSTYAISLLPWWTDGCIGAVEGLYSDSSPTSSFVFIAESALSKVFSSYEPGLPYEPFDLERGVRYLRELGVEFYIAHSPEVREAANAAPGLRSLASSDTWEVFAVDGVSLVEPLLDIPVVASTGGDREAWQHLAVAWFTRADPDFVRVAADGPPAWPRLDSIAAAPESPGTTFVTNVVDGGNEISFHVDTTGVPVLVRASYFPTWHAEGAEGPWRVAPNWMVVIPSHNDVRLAVGTGGVEAFASVLSLTGIAVLGGVAVWLWFRRRQRGAG